VHGAALTDIQRVYSANRYTLSKSDFAVLKDVQLSNSLILVCLRLQCMLLLSMLLRSLNYSIPWACLLTSALQMCESFGMQLDDDSLLALYHVYDPEGTGYLAYMDLVKHLMHPDTFCYYLG